MVLKGVMDKKTKNLTWKNFEIFQLFFDHMVQKYQNEIPPIFYYRISTKSSEKVLKIPNLQALTLGRIIKITLYDAFYIFYMML